MGFAELFFIAAGLSMDAFAVSVCKGLSVKKVKWMHGITAGLYFGGFQALMPLLGYLLGVQFRDVIGQFDHWIAFFLLGYIGFDMLGEARTPGEALNDSFSFRAMLPLAVATSIDALAVGVTFAFLKVNVTVAVAFIGIITFFLSAAGVKIGNVFGLKYQSKAKMAGGIVLILMAFKILLEHLNILTF